MAVNKEDEKFMMRCLQLAKKGLGNTFPNPAVGSVIVHKGRIIGEGYHTRAGNPHAEVEAIADVKEKHLLNASTLYVNLEPCAHYGKTPPCARRIVKEGIPRVVVGALDPNPKVAGKGVAIMEEGGVEVISGVLKDKARMLNRRFFTSQTSKRPHVILKWAQTLDGFIDMVRKPDAPIKPNWITNEISRINVHKWRAREQAIMIGTATARKDNPKLNVRNWSGPDPLRVVLDKELQLDPSLNLMDGTAPTLVYNARESKEEGQVQFRQVDFSMGNDYVLRQVLDHLHTQGIQSLFVEGGAALINSFIRSGLWDEARMFIGNTFFHDGVKAPSLQNEELMREEHFGHSKLFVFRNANNVW